MEEINSEPDTEEIEEEEAEPEELERKAKVIRKTKKKRS